MTAQPRTIAEAASMLPAPTMRVYRAIRAAATQGDPAPTTAVLADIAATKSATGHLARLVKAGMIRVERRSGTTQSRKRFLDIRSGCWTGWVVLRDRRKSGPPRRPLSPQAERMLAMVRAAAIAGSALPSTHEIGEAVGVSADDVSNLTKALKVRGLIKVEASANRMRRMWVADLDRWTGWSEPPLQTIRKAEPPPAPPTVPKPAIAGGYSGQRYEDDPHFAALGRTGRPIIGRPGSGFIAREASC